ncbi:hypothetical protein CQ018_02475 [Arthrobacter sp. MYb227]|uniref:hypothetical protein n=1 Tax=Arthrobacter sp. MYb227 TaxID=1848601 RepID=UPI000CFA9CEF|nr:hypothetical protein [Arthrobacter sp. MYb227]PQZ96165.1 hypothetical protein CQ018_02475 [Arthrobacter sp. MYb227]
MKKRKNYKIGLISLGALATTALVIGIVAALGTVAPVQTADAGALSPGKAAETADVAKVDPQTGKRVRVDAQAQVVKELGEEGKLTAEGESKPTFSIIVKNVQVKKSCAVRGFGTTIAPDNGHFLIVEVQASLAKSANAVVREDEAIMPLDASSFGVSNGSSDKISYNLNTEKAYGCEVRKPLDIAVGAGDTVTGQVVLDAKTARGELVYNPLDAQQKRSGGWTWSF